MWEWLDWFIGLAVIGYFTLIFTGLGLAKLGEWREECRQTPSGKVEWIIRKILVVVTVVAFWFVPPLMAIGLIKEIFGVAEGWPLLLGFGLGLGLMMLIATHPVMKRWGEWLEGKSHED